jgi:transmembrane sensor
MKEMSDMEKYTGNEWEKIASLISGEQKSDEDLLSRFMAEDSHNTVKYWKELNEMKNEKEIDVDKAWNNLYSRLGENGLIPEKETTGIRFTRMTWFRIAATFLILLTAGSGIMLLNNRGVLSRKTVVATTDNQKNLQVTLPDGSNVYLNRNTKLSYRQNFGRHGRNVTLSGEAFFDITHDEKNPFTIDAGKARIRVLGTSFNVITSNADSSVEVFVRTGKVMLSDNSGARSLVVDPGFVGTINEKHSEKTANSNPNYLAWNTGRHSILFSGILNASTIWI